MCGPPDLMLGECVSSLSLSRRVRISLDILEEHITSSSPHFIYCLCPSEVCESSHPPDSTHLCLHPSLTPPLWLLPQDSGDILQQVQHLQLVDIALMQSTGYPVHINIEEFVERYANAILCEASLPMTADTCTRVLEHADLTQWCVGRSQVFLKPWHVDQLEEQLSLRVHSNTMMQNGTIHTPHQLLLPITSSSPSSPSILTLQLTEGIRR